MPPSDISVLHPIFKARCAFVMAHPGHELRVHSWLNRLQPQVILITDGSGRGGADHVALSACTIDQSGASLNAASAQWTDHQAYNHILTCNAVAVSKAINDVAQELAMHSIEWVICDAIEGFNPVHDLCSVMAVQASSIAERATGKAIKCVDFPLEGPPESATQTGERSELKLNLSDEEWRAKREAIAQNSALQFEIDRGFRLYGERAFRTEVLTPVNIKKSLSWLAQNKPFYEVHGEKRVQEGVYKNVLRYREHFLPLVEQVSDMI